MSLLVNDDSANRKRLDTSLQNFITTTFMCVRQVNSFHFVVFHIPTFGIYICDGLCAGKCVFFFHSFSPSCRLRVVGVSVVIFSVLINVCIRSSSMALRQCFANDPFVWSIAVIMIRTYAQ